MGRHSKRKRSTNAASKDHFPIGELATKRKQIREEYLKKCQDFDILSFAKNLSYSVAKPNFE
jgi:hypothetical protein